MCLGSSISDDEIVECPLLVSKTHCYFRRLEFASLSNWNDEGYSLFIVKVTKQRTLEIPEIEAARS